MFNPLAEKFGHVHGSDLVDYGAGFPSGIDFCDPSSYDDRSFDWVICNPPFKFAQEFIDQGQRIARQGVAMFLKINFLEADVRYQNIFIPNWPSHVYGFVERVPINMNRLGRTTATFYAWFIWDAADFGETRFRWIPPCRTRLQRPDEVPPREPKKGKTND
jgi:hypothetical protein